MFNPARQDKWVFGSRETGFYLRKFTWTKIVRHRMVAGRASPDDPALTGYWDQRRRRTRLPVDPATWHLLRRQRGQCPLCRGLLLNADRQPQGPEEWQQWHTATRKAIRKHAISVTSLGTPDERAAHHLIHARCQRRISEGSPALLPGPEPSGLLEPSCPESRYGGSEGTPRGNAPGLPDERWFAELTNHKLRRSAHRSVTEPEDDIRKWINEWNKNPKPFVWTKSADDILETVAEYCQRITDSGH
jgi:hypothetical protein